MNSDVVFDKVEIEDFVNSKNAVTIKSVCYVLKKSRFEYILNVSLVENKLTEKEVFVSNDIEIAMEYIESLPIDTYLMYKDNEFVEEKEILDD